MYSSTRRGASHLFLPEHFNEPPVKDLMSVHVDPVTGVPSFKRTGVTIEKGVSAP